jgi:hypothetical protein
MRYFKYLHSILLVLALTGFTSIGLSQTDTTIIKKGKGNHDDSLYGSAGYGSNMIYLGSTISDNLPFFSSSLIYGLDNKLFISATASHINKLSPFVALYSITGSYNQTVNSWFDYSANIAFYSTPQLLKEKLFNNFGLVNLTTGFDWKLLYTRLSVSEIVSESSSTYFQIRNSHYFQTGRFFKQKAFLSFDPNINLLFGRLVKIETTSGSQQTGNAPPFKHLKKKQNTSTSYSYVFGMMDTEFSLPVTLNLNNISLEAEALYILPAYSNREYSAPEGFSLNLTVYIKLL